MGNEQLTRENRYEGWWRISEAVRRVPGDGSLPPPFSEPVMVTLCRSCGSLVGVGSEDLHERLHPAAGCERVHPEAMVACLQPHAWEDQFR